MGRELRSPEKSIAASGPSRTWHAALSGVDLSAFAEDLEGGVEHATSASANFYSLSSHTMAAKDQVVLCLRALSRRSNLILTLHAY